MSKLLIPLFLLLSISLTGQSYYDIAKVKTGQMTFVKAPVVALWVVENVTVGNEQRTPTAKWFDFKENGLLMGGNGGITNLRGSWTFDQENKQLYQQDGDRIDPFGPFEVLLTANETMMTWRRLEDGVEVTVRLKKASKKPLAPWDLIVGNWRNEKAEGLDLETKEVKSYYQMEPNSYYFGWDRRYRKYDKDGNRVETGIWHIEAHSPWLWTINDAENTKVGWSIAFEGSQMIWSREGEMEVIKVYFDRMDE